MHSDPNLALKTENKQNYEWSKYGQLFPKRCPVNNSNWTGITCTYTNIPIIMWWNIAETLTPKTNNREPKQTLLWNSQYIIGWLNLGYGGDLILCFWRVIGLLLLSFHNQYKHSFIFIGQMWRSRTRHPIRCYSVCLHVHEFHQNMKKGSPNVLEIESGFVQMIRIWKVVTSELIQKALKKTQNLIMQVVFECYIWLWRMIMTIYF